MSGKRIKDPTITQHLIWEPALRVLLDRMDDATPGDWVRARNIELALLGNTRFQGSENGSSWHNAITASDTYFRFSTNGGESWTPLDTDAVTEGSTNLYFTEARVVQTPGVADAITLSHLHANKTLLDNLINNGPGNNFLADDGSYKSASHRSITTKTSNYTAAGIDDVILIDTSSTNVTITLPLAADNEGKVFTLKSISNLNIATIATTGSDEIDNDPSNMILDYVESIIVVSDGSNWWII